MMRSAQRLEFQNVPISGFNLVEASAGTGKTWTLSALYVRAILEKRLPVESILVITFTNAATAELATRIRQRLTDVLQVLQQEQANDDPLLQYVYETYFPVVDQDQFRQTVLHVEQCLLNFDQAAIFTIHGFSQRVLTDYAFMNQQAFNMTLQSDTSVLLRQLVQDYWRKTFYSAPLDGLRCLLQQSWFNPEYFERQLGNILGRPSLSIPGEKFDWQAGRLVTLLDESWQQAADIWQSQGSQIAALIQENKAVLNKRSAGSIEKALLTLDSFFLSPQRSLNPEKAYKYFSQSGMVGATLKKKEPLQHAFFAAMEVYLEHADSLNQALLKVRDTILYDVFHYCQAELDSVKRQQKAWGFDDLLLNLRKVLDSEMAAVVIDAVSRSYPVALIDEFQDTDPVQYQNIKDLFKARAEAVFLVGDPKQAIYSFRGADLFTYLSAREDVDNLYFIDTNFRSVAGLVDAVNALFEREKPPAFMHEDMGFVPSKAGPGSDQSLFLDGEAVVPMNFCQPLDEESKLPSAIVRQVCLQDMTRRIVEMIDAGQAGKLVLNNKAFQAANIAVLVRSHKQAQQVQRALAEAGVGSSLLSQSSVLLEREADWLALILQVMASPHDIALLKTVLLLPVFNLPATDIAGESAALDKWLALFYEAHMQWQDQGIFVALTEFLARNQLRQVLYSMPGGERVLTNFNHLIEILHQQEFELNARPDALLYWYEEIRQLDKSQHPEFSQLRLDSESNLVKVVTIHASKGLEYDVVFCPVVWHQSRAHSSDYFIYHDDAGLARFGSGSQDVEGAELSHRESLEEDLRLLYVAFTRAKNACYLYWARVKSGSYGGMAWLLHPATSADKADKKAVWEKLGQEQIGEVLSAWHNRDANVYAYHYFDTDMREVSAPVADTSQLPVLCVRDFTAQPTPMNSRLSFSTLLRRTGGYRPDYDDAQLVEQAPEKDFSNFYHFPKGAVPGECVHYIFEHYSFVSHDSERLQALIESALERYSISSDWLPAVTLMVNRVLACTLAPDGFRLQDISTPQRLNELRFDYTIDDIRWQQALAVIQQDPLLANVNVNSIQFNSRAGLMTGFIDLICEYQGRFYIVDYKSNWLGSSPSAYEQQALNQVIIHESYYLQYMIYVVALHRYLRLRLPEYQYDKHFGGVYYLFVRACGDGQQAEGVYYHLPDINVIEALDTLLGAEYVC